MLASSYLFLLATDTHPGELKSAKCRFESDWGHSRRAYSSAVASLSLPRAILGPGAERLSSRADVVSGRIEHQHHQVNHIVAGQSFCAVHPSHQKLIGGGNDTERKHVYFA
jgi:hypothetical protein